jgi:hypothetical protein
MIDGVGKLKLKQQLYSPGKHINCTLLNNGIEECMVKVACIYIYKQNINDCLLSCVVVYSTS